MKILIVDTYYPDFLKSLSFDPNSTYDVELRKVLDYQFGTSDFYSKNLKALGWEAVDVIANHLPLQELWRREHGKHDYEGFDTLVAQMFEMRPDVVFVQDLSVYPKLGTLCDVIAAQLSCPWPGDENVRQCDIIYTSFPHYIPRIEKLGVRAIYNPLAFEQWIAYEWVQTNTIKPSITLGSPGSVLKEAWLRDEDRIHDCVFIGGVGNPSHWKRGMETLYAVCDQLETFKWWGYGYGELRGATVRSKYQGQAFGSDMFNILLRSKIVLNRHGEVAEGFAQNMRMYEATGCGALLVTDNETDLFADDEIVRYSNPQDAVDKIRYYLAHEDERAAIAAKGQQRTLTDHTYAKRMQVVSDTLQEMLVTA